MTLETMGVSFKQIETTRGLEEALEQFNIGHHGPTPTATEDL